MKDAIWKKIEKLDLSKVKEKLQKRKGLWWNIRTDLDKLEMEYRQFLYLIAANPTEMVIPWSEKLDEFWHEHILDTQKYANDCDDIFGKYIHHNPHVDKGTSKHDKAYNKTKEMYRDAFKDKADKKTGTSDSAGCGTFMPVVFCGTAHCSDSGSHSGGGSHCGTSGDGGGSSCGSSCGGGCGGGGD